MTALSRFVVRHEAWLPLAAGVLWWIAMYPGLLAEDSIYTIGEIRSGTVTVWFTAWWPWPDC